MHRLSGVAALGLALVAGGGSSCGEVGPQPFARAVRIETLADAIGGEKALARPGDLLLENDHLRVAILAATTPAGLQRNSMGPGLYAGTIVDVDLQRYDPRFSRGRGLDQFAELIPTVNMNVMAPVDPADVEIVADGSDGGAAIVRVTARCEPFLQMLGALWALVGAPDFWMVTDYIAEPGVPWLTLRSTIVVGEDPTLPVPVGIPVDYADDELPVIDMALEDGLAAGDFYLSGGSVDVFAPGTGFDEDLEVYEAGLQGRNSFADPFRYDFVAGVADRVSYGIAPARGAAFVPLFTASQTAMFGGVAMGHGTPRFDEGEAFVYERYLFVGHGDVGSIVDGYLEARGLPWGRVTGHAVEQGTAAPLPGVDVFVFEPAAERPWSQWRTDVHPDDDVPDGSFGGRLPVGDWELLVHVHGRPDPERVAIEVVEGEAVRVELASPRPGRLSFTVRDEVGRPLPAKVTLFREDGPPLRDSVLGDGFFAGGSDQVLFPMYGTGEVDLQPGTWRAIASRGLEYEIDERLFEVRSGQRVTLDLEVQRTVDTSGWVSADFHVHAAPSHDSGVALADRVRTMVCEGVEFFASSDHDVITDYAPTVEQLGLEEWVQTAVGTEVTTVELGHFLGFPLGSDFLGESGGALDWTGMRPRQIFEWMDAEGVNLGSDPVLFVGHPRDGILGYFDQYGFDPYHGTPGSDGNPGTAALRPGLLSATNPLLWSENFSWNFDGLELLNGKRIELVRSPTQPEVDGFAAGDGTRAYDFLTRTLEEQSALANGTYTLGYGQQGGVDDWFSLLNLGFRYTLLGNSDTHGWSEPEAGCPRNFVMSETDDPAWLDDQAIADAVRAHQVVASYGPFVRMTIDGAGIGSEVETVDGEVEIAVQVQAPTWMVVDRLELYANGELVEELPIPDTGDVLRLDTTITRTIERDTWFVVAVMGDGDLSPVVTPVEIPYIDLQEVVTEALAGVESISNLLDPAVPVPREYVVPPYAITNPIWVDLAGWYGDGFDAPGIPDWLVEPEPPEGG